MTTCNQIAITFKISMHFASNLAPFLIVFALHRYGVSLLSGSDSLKHITKGFSVNHFLNQLLVLGIDINSFYNSFLGWYEQHTRIFNAS